MAVLDHCQVPVLADLEPVLGLSWHCHHHKGLMKLREQGQQGALVLQGPEEAHEQVRCCKLLLLHAERGWSSDPGPGWAVLLKMLESEHCYDVLGVLMKKGRCWDRQAHGFHCCLEHPGHSQAAMNSGSGLAALFLNHAAAAAAAAAAGCYWAE